MKYDITGKMSNSQIARAVISRCSLKFSWKVDAGYIDNDECHVAAFVDFVWAKDK